MPHLRKLPASRYWIAAFYDVNGKQLTRSTRIPDTGPASRKAAMRIAEEWEALARLERAESQVMETTREIIATLTGDRRKLHTPRTWLAMVLEEKAVSTSAGTQRNWRYASASFLEGIGDIADKPLAWLKAEAVNTWQTKELARIHPNSLRMYRGLMRTAFDRAVKTGEMKASPFDLAETVQTEDAVRTAFSLAQVRDLLKVADHEWRGMILLGLYCGTRIGDAKKFTWKMFDMEGGKINYKPTKTRKKTGGHTMPTVPVPLREYLTTLPVPDTNDAPLFPELSRLGVETLDGQFSKIMTRAGIERPKQERHGDRRTRHELSYHSLKHSLVTLMKEAGASEAVAMAAVGHRSRAVSQVYTHNLETSVKTAFDTLPDVTQEAPR